MTLAIIASLPGNSDPIVGCVEWVIHKKIADVALNCIEQLIDWLLSRLYSPYNEFYKNKKARIHNLSNEIEVEGQKNPLRYLFDSTEKAIVQITHDFEKVKVSLNKAPICFDGSNPFEETSEKEEYLVIEQVDSCYTLTKKKEGEMNLCWLLEEFRNPKGEIRYFGKEIAAKISSTASTK